MRRVVLALGIIFTTSSALFAQVHIQEKAVITPAKAKKVREESTAHKIKFTFDWVTWGISVPETARVEIVGGCGFDCVYSQTGISKGEGAGYGNSLDIELSIPTAGDYSFFASIFKYNHYDTGIFCTLSYDDSLVYSITGTTEASDNDSVNVWRPVLWHWGGYATRDPLYYETPYCSSFSLNLYGFPLWMPPGFCGKGVDYGQEIGIYLNGSYDCSPNIWHPYYPVTLSVISGHQYASFHTSDPETGNDIKLGSVVNTTGEGIGSYYLVADSVQPDSAAGWVIVKAECDGITSIDSAQVLPPPVVVRVIPPEVAPGDTAAVVLKQRNPDGTLADFAPYQQFEVQIDSGSDYGTILSQGDTADYFESTPQGFNFIAVDSINSDSEMVGIQVGPVQGVAGIIAPGGKGQVTKATILKNRSLSANVKSPHAKYLSSMKTNGGRKSVSFTQGDYGIGWVTIKKKGKLSLNVSVDPSEVRPWNTGGNSQTTVSVLATEDGKPVSGIPIQLSAKGVEGTGGHDHDGSRPAGIFSVSSGVTGDDGKFVSTYTASEFGGIERITASSSGVKDSIDVIVKVDGLVPLAGSRNLITFTSTEAYHKLANSDYGTPATLAVIQSGVGEYAFEYGMSADVYLAVIDMSLPWGGLFDVLGNWRPKHDLHRVGKSVDFSKFYRNASGDKISVGIYIDGTLRQTTNTIDEEKLDNKFSALHFKRLEAPLKIHYESQR